MFLTKKKEKEKCIIYMDGRAVIWSVVKLSCIVQGNLREDWEFCRSEALRTCCQESSLLGTGPMIMPRKVGLRSVFYSLLLKTDARIKKDLAITLHVCKILKAQAQRFQM